MEDRTPHWRPRRGNAHAATAPGAMGFKGLLEIVAARGDALAERASIEPDSEAGIEAFAGDH